MFVTLFKESLMSFLRSLTGVVPSWLLILFYGLIFLTIWINIFPWWVALIFSFLSLEIALPVLLIGFIVQLAYLSF